MRRVMHVAICTIAVVGVMLSTAPQASAQGCILLRQTSPMFGTTGAAEQEVGTWNVTITARASQADIHYRGKERQYQRETLGTYVLNRQHSLTTTISYQLSNRISINAGVPFVEASWGIPSPQSAGPSARANENARGLGDITTLARFSIFNPETHRSWNVQIGGGVKMPTGNDNATDIFPTNTGLPSTNVERHVDISVLPGDGGWGVIMDAQGFKQIWRVMTFGSGTYLANPKNTGARTRGTVVVDAPAPTSPQSFNTVSDQFVLRAGASVGITRQIAATLAWRAEGVPRYDLWGRADGFRRPGVEMYWEPGVTLTSGRHAVSLNVPIGYYYNRFPNPYTGNAGDSTFPEVVAIATYSMRFGGTTSHLMPVDNPISSQDQQQQADATSKTNETSSK
jgi:hypothetical protein